MSKKIVNKSSNTKETKSETVSNGFFPHISFLKNLILFFITGLVLLMIFKGNSGYDWVRNILLAQNLKFINQYPHLTIEERYQSKFGIDAAALQQIAKATPENAIILFPPISVILSDTAQYRFLKEQGGLKMRNWALYFLYPRKLVYADEIEKLEELSKKATHVLCLNGWGYDKLNYEVEQKQAFQILEIKK